MPAKKKSAKKIYMQKNGTAKKYIRGAKSCEIRSDEINRYEKLPCENISIAKKKLPKYKLILLYIELPLGQIGSRTN